MVKIQLDNFDIGQICDSGQCFRMEKLEDGSYCVIAGINYLKITQSGNTYVFHCESDEFEQIWSGYFDLHTDYGAYISRIDPDDEYLNCAARYGSGIRILKQDLWEMIVSFLISQQNNILRIRRCIRNICEKYGEMRHTADGTVYYGFPEPESLAELDEDELKECNLGYRSKYVVRTARSIVSGEFSLNKVANLPYEEAKAELLKLYGVGEKVADCICLFSLHQLSAFPVDTHIRQALDKHYLNGYDHIRYAGIQGVMQQYIFYYERMGADKIR